MQRRPHSLPILLTVVPNPVPQHQIHPSQERRNCNIRICELVPDRERLVGGEERLDGLERVEVRLGGLAAEGEGGPGGGDLGADVLDEEARAGALDGVLGQEVRVRVEVGEELDEDEALGDLDGVGRGLVGRGGCAAVRYGRNLFIIRNTNVSATNSE